MNENIGKPASSEYLAYYGKYVSLVPDGDILTILSKQIEETTGLLNSIPESRGGLRYAPDKWSIKELVGHLIDTERIFAYRALRFARNDKTPLPGYEQDDYEATVRALAHIIAGHELHHRGILTTRYLSAMGAGGG